MRTLVGVASNFYRFQPHRIPHCRWQVSNVVASSAKQSFHDDFMTWIRNKTSLEISSVLAIGSSHYGRSLFASQCIECGECILKIPHSVHLTPDKILPAVLSLVADDIEPISRLAVVVLAEQKLGMDSEWFPYINSLPRISDMHNTVFWTQDELKMIKLSPVYEKTIQLKSFLAKEFSALKPALQNFPSIFGDVKLKRFVHAYSLVVSRAWGTSEGVSLVPFADFLNHDRASESVLLSDEDKGFSEVIADRNYAIGDEILIRYGNFSNSTLMLNFGFTLQDNIHDQVEITMDVPLQDPLHSMKMGLLCKHSLQPISNKSLTSSGSSFIIKEIKNSSKKRKGIPLALRAFARILSVSTCEDLKALSINAFQSDGRLARQPLKDIRIEIEAHRILLSKFETMIESRDAAIKDLELSNERGHDAQPSLRRQMAINLLKGELRVLKSAAAWITNYCESLLAYVE
ncbi:hypothetical protein HPP92_020786 [Vanilla planifolia]|uniref:SET domain-containing protein n=1 Tax=Vanilla planifolia TaxID=51239 RepID=A0A835UIT5_VANPL|nr:hypothetical protein HPP92_020786 [Vanilla planifolia]